MVRLSSCESTRSTILAGTGKAGCGRGAWEGFLRGVRMYKMPPVRPRNKSFVPPLLRLSPAPAAPSGARRNAHGDEPLEPALLGDLQHVLLVARLAQPGEGEDGNRGQQLRQRLQVGAFGDSRGLGIEGVEHHATDAQPRVVRRAD